MKRSLKETNATLLIGFSLLLILMVTLMVASTSEMLSMRNQLDRVVNQKLVKSQLAQTMFDASRERALLLMMLQYEDDPFERDELQMRFQRYAESFMLARDKLYGMELSEQERNVLRESITYASIGADAMNSILSIAMERTELSPEQRLEASQIMQERVLPARSRVGELMMEVGWIAREEGEQMVREAEQGYSKIWNLMWILGGAILLISVGIFHVVYRRIMNSSKELHGMYSELDHVASHDDLTGLYNRRTFETNLSDEIERAKRYQDMLAILYLDLDGFKAVNDLHGHNSGDQVLQWVSKHFLKQVRDHDKVARLGGDEFAILLSNIHSERSAEDVAQRILKGLSTPLALGSGEAVKIGVSVGIAFYPRHGERCERLIQKADHAMYAAKRRGKHAICIAETDTETET